MEDHITEIRITKYYDKCYRYDLRGYYNGNTNKSVLLSCVDTTYETFKEALNAAKEHASWADSYTIDDNLKITYYKCLPDNKGYVQVKDTEHLILYLIIIFAILIYLIYTI